MVCWAVFGIGLAGFVPLTGSALAVSTLAAGLSTFLGPVLVALLGGTANMAGLIWTFVGMYVVGALLTLVLKSSQDPGQRGRIVEEAREEAPATA